MNKLCTSFNLAQTFPFLLYRIIIFDSVVELYLGHRHYSDNEDIIVLEIFLQTNLIELSMIFETLRGELPCRIPIVEKVLGLKNYLMDHNIFIVQIVSMLQNQDLSERIKNDNTLQEKRKSLCKIEGCKQFAHYAFEKDCVCYKHADKEKKLCKQCRLRVGRNKGDLCNHCFTSNNKKYDSNGSTDKLCKNCMARPTRIAGGLCKICRIGGRETLPITWGGVIIVGAVFFGKIIMFDLVFLVSSTLSLAW